MNCIITGVETQNKYKNRPVSTKALFAAKQIMELDKCTLRQALKKLQRDFREHVRKMADAEASCREQGNTGVRQ